MISRLKKAGRALRKCTFVLRNDLMTRRSSEDSHPWKHPFLTRDNIRRFREYSEEVWRFALDKEKNRPTVQLKCAFVVNMAQNMYKWGCLAQKYGARATLFTHPFDNTAISCPEWEEFDGEYSDIFDGAGFRKDHGEIQLRIPCERVSMGGDELLFAHRRSEAGDRSELLRFLSSCPSLRYEALVKYDGFLPYHVWARALSTYDVIYAASAPFAAYASGRPYCVFSVGGDMSFDCGRGDEFGLAMAVSFNAARFMLVSNPHTLGHCRRLGFKNALYLPYPMDDSRYCPGRGDARQLWEERYGSGVYVLTTARLDAEVKGHGEKFLEMLVEVAKKNEDIRFVFLKWGADAERFQSMISSFGVGSKFVALSPVGKKKLIDYYRSCDVVLDHFVWGYYGATTLEAAAIGKPVIMKLREEHYSPLYDGDVAPVENVTTYDQIAGALLRLAESRDRRIQQGEEMRAWLKRNHGEEKTVPLMLALLRLAADNISLPKGLRSPLQDEETEYETKYHEACLRMG